MYVGTTRKSFARFFTLALLMSSWPLRMPPRSRPMITSTIAISTSVNPDCCDFILMLLILASMWVLSLHGSLQAPCQTDKILFFRGFWQVVRLGARLKPLRLSRPPTRLSRFRQEIGPRAVAATAAPG